MQQRLRYTLRKSCFPGEYTALLRLLSLCVISQVRDALQLTACLQRQI